MASETLGDRMPGRTLQGLPVINVLKRIDEIAQLDFTVWERNSVDEAPQQKFGPKPEMLLELRAGPYHHVRDAQFHGGRSNLIATLGRDTAAAYELEGRQVCRSPRSPPRPYPSPPLLGSGCHD